METNTQSLEFALKAVNGIAEREERGTCTQKLKVKLERLRSTKLTRHDQEVNFQTFLVLTKSD
jgi:hypothetical protein